MAWRLIHEDGTSASLRAWAHAWPGKSPAEMRALISVGREIAKRDGRREMEEEVSVFGRLVVEWRGVRERKLTRLPEVADGDGERAYGRAVGEQDAVEQE